MILVKVVLDNRSSDEVVSISLRLEGEHESLLKVLVGALAAVLNASFDGLDVSCSIALTNLCELEEVSLDRPPLLGSHRVLVAEQDEVSEFSLAKVSGCKDVFSVMSDISLHCLRASGSRNHRAQDHHCNQPSNQAHSHVFDNGQLRLDEDGQTGVKPYSPYLLLIRNLTLGTVMANKRWLVEDSPTEPHTDRVNKTPSKVRTFAVVVKIQMYHEVWRLY